jgi:hypothetical protein
MKIAEPIIDPATIMVLSNSPKPRLNPCAFTSWRSAASFESDVTFLRAPIQVDASRATQESRR